MGRGTGVGRAGGRSASLSGFERAEQMHQVRGENVGVVVVEEDPLLKGEAVVQVDERRKVLPCATAHQLIAWRRCQPDGRQRHDVGLRVEGDVPHLSQPGALLRGDTCVEIPVGCKHAKRDILEGETLAGTRNRAGQGRRTVLPQAHRQGVVYLRPRPAPRHEIGAGGAYRPEVSSVYIASAPTSASMRRELLGIAFLPRLPSR